MYLAIVSSDLSPSPRARRLTVLSRPSSSVQLNCVKKYRSLPEKRLNMGRLSIMLVRMAILRSVPFLGRWATAKS